MWQSGIQKNIMVALLFTGNILADTLGPTTLLQNDGGVVGAPPYPCYNTIDKQFFIGWVSGALYNAIYDTTGTKLHGRTLMVENGGTVIPFTMPGSCHNRKQNHYFISFLGLSDELRAWYSILDHEGNTLVGPRSVNNYAGDRARSIVFCCYNSHDDQYAVTWASEYGLVYFSIIDAEGNVILPAHNVSGASINAGGGYCPFITYNSHDNEYLFTWQNSSDNKPHFAVYHADGTAKITAAGIESPTESFAIILSSCYNSDDNQYLITWNNIYQQGYFAIYNADGTVAKSATLFSDQVHWFNYGSVFSTYNNRNKEYFISWEGTDGKSKCAAFDTHGNLSLETVTIPNIEEVFNYGSVTQAYSPDRNSFLMSWIGPIEMSQGYYALFFRTPPIAQPASGSGVRILNRFANYGEYFNRLTWSSGGGTNAVGYHVYQSGVLIATVPVVQTQYDDHNQPNVPVTYAIRAYDATGQESDQLDIYIA